MVLSPSEVAKDSKQDSWKEKIENHTNACSEAVVNFIRKYEYVLLRFEG